MSFYKCLSLSIASICLASPAAYASAGGTDTSGYQQLREVLESGRDVTSVVDFSACSKAETEEAGPQVVGGFHIKSFIIPDGRYIAFSNVHQTLSSQLEPVTEYIRYKVMPDGAVSVSTAAVTVGDTADDISETRYTCQLGEGARFIW